MRTNRRHHIKTAAAHRAEFDERTLDLCADISAEVREEEAPPAERRCRLERRLRCSASLQLLLVVLL